MALARLNIPGLVLYGGTIAPGNFNGKDVTIQDVFEAVGANAAGKMTDADLLELENVACPGAGACGGQYTANTMSTVMELIGLSPMGFNSVPAMDPQKDQVAYRLRRVVMNLLRKGVTPAGYPHPPGVRKRHRRRRRHRRLDQRGAAPAGDRARSRSPAAHRRFPESQRAHSAAGRPETLRPLRGRRRGPRRRHSPVGATRLVAGQVPARRLR